MRTTFWIRNRTWAEMKRLLGSWRCRVENNGDQTCNVIFFDQEEWNRFETWAEDNGIDYELL